MGFRTRCSESLNPVRGRAGLRIMSMTRRGRYRYGVICFRRGICQNNRNKVEKNFVLSGQTLDASGNPLADCIVNLHHTVDDKVVGSVHSDGSGNFSFVLGSQEDGYYLVAYKAGSPDLAGTTLDDLGAV